MSNQLFTSVGITVHNDNVKVRFTDDMVRRIKQFTKGGATRCDFIELPSEMNKIEALRFMLEHPNFQSAEDQATIADTLADKEKAMGTGTVRVQQEAPSLDAIRARGRNDDATVEDVLEAVSE